MVVSHLTSLLGCKVGCLPMTYLGPPLGSPFKSKVVWNTIMEKVERRLSKWKKIYLSNGGQLTLIKSMISSLPHIFFYFNNAHSCCQQIGKVTKRLSQGSFIQWIGGWCVLLIKLCLESGYGGLGWKMITSGDMLLILNMGEMGSAGQQRWCEME